MTITRSQTIAILAAALLVAVLGLALLLGLLVLNVDALVAQTALTAPHGQMNLPNVVNAVTSGGDANYQFLSK